MCLKPAAPFAKKNSVCFANVALASAASWVLGGRSDVICHPGQETSILNVLFSVVYLCFQVYNLSYNNNHNLWINFIMVFEFVSD